jgi:hypothetical protein
MMIKSASLILFLSSVNGYIVERPGSNEKPLKNVGGGLPLQNLELEKFAQQGLTGNSDDLFRRLNLGSAYASAAKPTVEPLSVVGEQKEKEETIQEQIEPTSIIQGLDQEKHESEPELLKSTPSVQAAKAPADLKVAQEFKSETPKMYPPITTGPLVNPKPKMRPATAFLDEESVNAEAPLPLATSFDDDTPLSTRVAWSNGRSARGVEDMETSVNNVLQDIPMLSAEESLYRSPHARATEVEVSSVERVNAAVTFRAMDEGVPVGPNKPATLVILQEEYSTEDGPTGPTTQLREQNNQAYSQSDYFANRYHYDSWFDNPNSNNLFLRAMHIEE